MKKGLGTVSFLFLVCVFTDTASSEPKRKAIATSYSLELIDAEMWGPIAIDNKGSVLIERQLSPGVQPVPLVIRQNGRETPPIQCPGTVNDTFGAGLNNKREVVGSCNGVQPIGFVANIKSGALENFTFPGSVSTWAMGINDFEEVVGFYSNPVEPPFCCFLPIRHLHAFSWNRATGVFQQIDHPQAEVTGGWTRLLFVNNKGQKAGFYNTLRNVPTEEYQFIYDNGTFTDVQFPGASQTHIEGLNHLGHVFGWYAGACGSARCLFIFDGEYRAIELALPANEPRPDGRPAGIATLSQFGGLNDEGQFVGSYIRVTAWAPDHLGNLNPSASEIRHFIASPFTKWRDEKKMVVKVR